MVSDEPELADADTYGPGRGGKRRVSWVNLHLTLSPEHAELLALRSQAAELSQGRYVSALLDGAVPPPVPAHFPDSVQALYRSTDHLAALSVDLNAFLRLVKSVPSAQLEPYRASLQGLVGDVRKHLVLAAGTLAELQPYRRARK